MTAMNACGLGKFFHPAWLQRFATARCFLVVYGLLGTIQSMSYIYFVATLTTLEKRFKIPSKTTGFMISGNEISQVLLSLLLSYYGGQRNRPLWIAWGVAFSGASCFILAVPHFLYGPGTTALSLTKEHMGSKFFNNTPVFASKDDAMLCTSDSRASSLCYNKDTVGEFSSVPPLLVFFSQFVLGIGTTLYFALGQTYIDDNTKKKNTPILLGLTLSLRTIGPAFGFVVGYFCLKLYIDPTLTPIIDNKDPRWLGAWWLGWLILGTTMVLFSLLISLFPKKLPPKKTQVDIAKNRECPVIIEQVDQKKPPNNSNKNQFEKLQINEEKSKAPTLKEFPSALARLLKNKLLMVNILSGVFYILGGSGYITYITKYLEIQFQTSAADASFIIGPTTILSMTLGFLGSGIFISKFRPRPTILLSWNVFVGLSFVIGEISFIFISCTSNSLMGYGNNSKSIQILNECNTACNCQGIKYSPVCLESEDVTFYSACHAGCKSRQTLDSSKMVYSNCSCIYPQIVELKFRAEDIEAEKHKYLHYSDPYVSLVSGPCKNNCYRSFVIFIGITCIMHFLGSSGKIGNILVNYRCVAEVDKSFAQGLSLLLISLLALIPGPIIYGYIIDATCIIWDETCGVRGNCWLYDRDDFRFNLNVTAAAMTTIGAILDGVVCYLGRNLDLYSDNESSSVACENTNKAVTNEIKNKTESTTPS